jgi:hypothetical protein
MSVATAACLVGSAVALAVMPAEAAMRRETAPAEPSEAVSRMLCEIVVTAPLTEIPVMAEVIEAAKAEAERVIDRIVRVSLVSIVVSVVGAGVGSRVVIRRRRTPGKDQPDTN